MARLFLAVWILIFLGGCSRSLNGPRSVISLKTPATLASSAQGKLSALSATPDHRTLCWAVNVTGPGISTQSNSCDLEVGTFAGFVKGGGTLLLDVAQGEDRQINLLLFLPIEGKEDCPTGLADLQSNPANYSMLYSMAKETKSLKADVETVQLTAAWPGIEQSVGKLSSLAACQASASAALAAQLTSSGDVSDGNGGVLTPDISSPTNESVLRVTGTAQGASSSAGVANFKGESLNVPPYVFSLTRKPDGDGNFFGLLHDGQVVQLDKSTGAVTAFDSTTCPFTTCKVPLWMEAISAGVGKDLFAKDHSGQIFKLSADGSLSLVDTVPPYIQHFSYF